MDDPDVLLHCAPFRFIGDMVNMEPAAIKAIIDDGLPGADVKVWSDDNTHYAALVIAESFAGKRPIARHQMVYECLGELIGNEIHAMSIRAYTPEEWAGLPTEAAD